MIRLRSLRRATVLVLCAILLTVVQTVMSLAWPGVWQQVVAAVLVAGIAAAAELERHIQEQEEADAQADGRLPPVALAAERLAVVVRDALTAEARRRGVTTPAPASVRWRWGSSEVAVPKDEIVSPAGGVGPGLLPAPRIAGGEAGTLLESGVVTRLHDEVYARLPHGRLVILGEAGAGKTGAMILLLLQALEHREGFERAARLGVPVPVWLTLGGWDPDAQPFRTWVLTVLDREHPYLRSAAFGSDAAQTLLASGHLALFLDGLDEMPAAARSAALRQLDAETANVRVVLTSRPQEYREALDQGRLHSAAVIEIRPVRPTVAASYLVRGEVGVRRDVWASVGDYLRLHPDSVPARALSTPLTLSLARFAYQHSDPAELVAQGRFASPGDLREHLVGGVLEAAYPDAKQRDRAIRWLAWAAHQMGDSRDLGWWHLATWIPRWRVQPLMAFVAVVAGSVTTFAGLAVLGAAFDIQTFAVPAGRNTTFATEDSLAGRSFINEFVLPLGAALGLAAWWTSLRANSLALRRDRPARLKPRLPRPREYLVLLRTVAISAVGLGILVGLLAGFGPLVVDAWDRAVTDGLGAQIVDRAAVENALQVALASGLGVGVAAGLVIGLFRIWSIPSDDAVAASPRSTYAGDRRARLAVSLLAGAAVGLSVGVLVGAVYGARSGLVFGGYAAVVVAVVFRVGFGLSTTLRFAEYVEHAPRLFPLLEDALERQVLRQAGSVYQFRHAELQDHLARAYLHGHRDVALRTGRLRGFVETAAVGAARTVRRALQPPRRRPVLIATGAVAVGAIAVVLAPVVGAMLRPDHDTLTDTPAEALAFSPDGDVLATSGDGKTVLWDVERREVLHELTGELIGSSSIASSVNAGAADLAFSRNGDIVATADGPVVRWWDVAEGRELSSGSAGAGQLVISFSPDRKVLATAEAATGRVSLWVLGSDEQPVELAAWSPRDMQEGFMTLGFSPDGQRVVTAGGDDRGGDVARVWEVSSGDRLTELTDAGDSDAAAFDPDGELLVVGSIEEGITVHQASSYDVVTTLDYAGGGVRLAPGGGLLAIGFLGEGLPGTDFNTGGRQQVWKLPKIELVTTFESQPDKLLPDRTTFNSDGTLLATAWMTTFDADGTRLLLWDLTSDAGSRELGRGNRELFSLAFDPEGRKLATGWSDGRVRIWDVSQER